MLREIAPSTALAHWVECFWHRPASGPASHRVVPDGCADIIFDGGDGSVSLVGPMTAPVIIAGERQPEMLGIRFRPGRAAALLRTPLHELVDLRVPLADVAPIRLEADGSLEQRIAALERDLARRAASSLVDRRIDAAVMRMTRGDISIDALARELGVTRQHLRRAFLTHVGLSPKTFARVMRFRRVLQLAARERRPSWSALAVDLGYSDQSHLIADFRELAGTTPVPFFLSL